MSNKKLTTEEKIVKSKEYEDEMTRLQNKMKTMRTAKKKLDAEIADELEKAEMVTNQDVGKKFRSQLDITLPLDKYGEIIDFMFMHEDCVEFIDDIIAKHKLELEKAKVENQEENSSEKNGEVAEMHSVDEHDKMKTDTETTPTDEIVRSDAGSDSA